MRYAHKMKELSDQRKMEKLEKDGFLEEVERRIVEVAEDGKDSVLIEVNEDTCKILAEYLKGFKYEVYSRGSILDSKMIQLIVSWN